MTWMRFDCRMAKRGWVAKLPATQWAAFGRLLLTVKLEGDHGAMRLSDFGAKWLRENRIPRNAFEEMLRKARDDGAIAVEDGWLYVLNWAKYQPDPTAAKRMQALRERQKQAKNRGVTGRYGTARNVTGRYGCCAPTGQDVDRTEQTDPTTKDNDVAQLGSSPAHRMDNDADHSKTVCSDNGPVCSAVAKNGTDLKRLSGALAGAKEDGAPWQVLKALRAIGFATNQVQALRQRHGDADILSAIRYTMRRQPVNPGGYIRRALEAGWHRRWSEDG